MPEPPPADDTETQEETEPDVEGASSTPDLDADQEETSDAANNEPLDETAVEREVLDQNEQADNQFENLQDVPPYSVVFTGFASDEPQTQIIVRDLPQIVVPGNALGLALLGYINDVPMARLKVDQTNPHRKSTGGSFFKGSGSVATWAAAAAGAFALYTVAYDLLVQQGANTASDALVSGTALAAPVT